MAKTPLLDPENLTLGRTSRIWKGAVGDGFRAGAFETGGALGVGVGMRVFFSQEAHDLALGSVFFGRMLGEVKSENKWYRGNWELLGEIFAGAQYRPHVDYVVGLGPLLRYNFATHSRWVPFVNAGGGLSATSIRGSDLSTTFEYNLQGGVGTHYFFLDHLALTTQYRYLHISNAGLKFPNAGANTSTFYMGLSWFF